MSVDNCQSTNAEPPGFIGTKSAGRDPQTSANRLAGKREVHIRRIGESFPAVYAVAHIAMELGTVSQSARDSRRFLFRCKRANAPTLPAQAASMGGIGVNDEEGLGKISRRWQFHRRHPRRHFNRRARDRADGGEHHGLAVPGVRNTHHPRPRNHAPGGPYRQMVVTIELCKRTLVRLREKHDGTEKQRASHEDTPARQVLRRSRRKWRRCGSAGGEDGVPGRISVRPRSGP